ncbi:hypothetical protein [Sediminibacterium soli]|uniref:hypothetical protein n=1 Tax=Sediminibacterium soli TaxID=2698829 RepID=UPI00137B8635|nr:hypothetical protein [Sediminibacterium soli]NCI47670.1 hypothetical protein [Sediminibacterium soli]
MKKLFTLATAAMLMTGFAFAHEGDKDKKKDKCCKDGKECKKDEKKEAKESAKTVKATAKPTAKKA